MTIITEKTGVYSVIYSYSINLGQSFYFRFSVHTFWSQFILFVLFKNAVLASVPTVTPCKQWFRPERQ